MKTFSADQVRQMLRSHMKNLSLNQRELAEQIGVSAAFLSSTLTGAREPQGKILEFLDLEQVVAYRFQTKRSE